MPSLFDQEQPARDALFDAWNLSGNPFHKDPPPDDLLTRVFVGRERELLRVGRAILDSPRNVMLRGGYGMGKTTFVKRLLSELAKTTSRRYLVAYGSLLGDHALDFQHAVLKALADSLRDTTVEAENVHQALLGNQRYEHPDLHIKSLLDGVSSSWDRVVIAIDELEKRPSGVILEVIVQCRPLFDLPCSFVIPGRLLDAMGHVDSSAFGAFDLIVDLEPFEPNGSRDILRRSLEVARAHAEDTPSLRPFSEPVVTRMIANSHGIPRVLHTLARALIDGTLEDALEAGDTPAEIDLERYESCLIRAGASAYAGIDTRGRDVIRTFGRHGGYIDQRNLAEYLDDDFPLDSNLQVIEGLTHNDSLLKWETAINVHYALQAPLDRYLEHEQKFKQRLVPLWQAVSDTTGSPQERGARLQQFAEELFGRVFRVVDTELRTQTEELDLVLEYRGRYLSWADTPLLLVECKNWSSRVPQREISALATKARLDDANLVFVVSVAGFTADARAQAERIRQRDRRLIVLVDGSDIEQLLSGDETADDFFQRLRRRARLNT